MNKLVSFPPICIHEMLHGIHAPRFFNMYKHALMDPMARRNPHVGSTYVHTVASMHMHE